MTLDKNHSVEADESSVSHTETPAYPAGACPHLLETDAIVEQFPLLVAYRNSKRPLAFLDNSSTTQKPACVLDALNQYYQYYNANPSRGMYQLGKNSTHIYANARQVVAQFINADASEVLFSAGATESLNMVAYTFGRSVLKPGDEIVLPVYEHHSNLIPWQTVASLTGARMKFVLPGENGHISEQSWRNAMGPKTKIVALAHVSNVLGSVSPLRAVSALAHEVGAYVVADCAQSVAHLPLDVRASDVDFAAFSAHKVYGPMGVGVLYGKKHLLQALEPLMRGGGMVEAVFENRTEFVEAPARFEAGTPNVAGAVGLAEALHFVQTIGHQEILNHEKVLLDRMLSGLAAIPDVEVYGDPGTQVVLDGALGEPSRCGVVAFNVKGTDASDVAEALDRDNIAIRAGAHCAEPLVRHLGVQGTCRASLALYNTEQDVDRFLESVEQAKRTVMLMILASMH